MKTTEGTATPATCPESEKDIVLAEVPTKLRRGFAAMDRAKVREIASKGGKQAHIQGTAHQFTSEEARSAGSKGGKAPRVMRGGGKKKAVES